MSLLKKVCKNACKFFSQKSLQLHLQVGLRPTVSGAVNSQRFGGEGSDIKKRKQLTALNFRSILDFPASSRANLGVRRPAGVGGAADLRVPARLASPPSRNRPLLVDRTSDSYAPLSPSTGHAAGHPPQGSEGHYLLTPARRMHGQKRFEGRGPGPSAAPLVLSRLLCFARVHWLPASDTGRTAGLRRTRLDEVAAARPAAALLAEGRRGFESQPRSGRVLPEVPRWARLRRGEPARRLDSGARAGAPAVGAAGGARKPVRGVRCGPPAAAPAAAVGRLWWNVAVEPGRRRVRPRAALAEGGGAGGEPGQRLRRAGGGRGRAPRRNRPRCWRKTWWRSLR